MKHISAITLLLFSVTSSYATTLEHKIFNNKGSIMNMTNEPCYRGFRVVPARVQRIISAPVRTNIGRHR